jgi:hypothetical protein
VEGRHKRERGTADRVHRTVHRRVHAGCTERCTSRLPAQESAYPPRVHHPLILNDEPARSPDQDSLQAPGVGLEPTTCGLTDRIHTCNALYTVR